MTVYIRVKRATLVADRTPMAPELMQFYPFDWLNLDFLPDDYFPGVLTQGYGYWPEVIGSPPLGQFQKYGDDISLTANGVTKTVTTVRQIIPWTDQEIYDFQFAAYIAIANEVEWRLPALENLAARSLGYYSDTPMATALTYRGMDTASGADADLLNDWRGAMRDYIMAQLEDVKLLTSQNLPLPSAEEIISGTPAFPIRP